MKFRKARKLSGALRIISFYLCSLLNITALGMASFIATSVFADDAVQLKVLVITMSSDDLGLDFIKPHLDEMGVPYDISDASITPLTTETLSPNGCSAATTGCVGNYNGVILTLSDLGLELTPSEWGILHTYEKDFHVREAVISGFPGTFSDPSVPRRKAKAFHAVLKMRVGLSVSATRSWNQTAPCGFCKEQWS